MKLHWIIYIFIFSIVNINAQKANTTIEGTALLLKNKPITWFQISDYLTEKENIILQDTIDENGKFNLSIPNEGIANIFLRIDNNNHALYLESGRNYNIEIADELGEILFYPTETDTTQVFYQIGLMNYEYNKFLSENYEKIIRKAAAPDARKFAQYLNDTYTVSQDSFFTKYREYKGAGLYLLTQATGMQKMFDKYLRTQSIDFSHPEMMYFLNHFYQGYIYRVQMRDKEKTFDNILYSGGPYQKMIDFLKLDPLIERTDLAEFFTLRALYDLYYNGQIKKEVAASFLHEIIANTSTEDIKKIARNFLGNLMRVSEGAEYFPFTGVDLMGNVKSSANYLEKPTYFMFFDIKHPKSIAEIRGLQNYQKNFRRNVNFVGVCESCTYSEIKEFRDKYNIQTDIIKVDNSVIKEYEVAGFPSSFIVSKSGHFLSVAAPLPTSTLEKELKNLVQSRK